MLTDGNSRPTGKPLALESGNSFQLFAGTGAAAKANAEQVDGGLSPLASRRVLHGKDLGDVAAAAALRKFHPLPVNIRCSSCRQPSNDDVGMLDCGHPDNPERQERYVRDTEFLKLFVTLSMELGSLLF